ncbi:MAG: hypothetical protein HEP71_26380 [Roseivirga sp.]|nr:hypothetical protein [Roseivirga sp.]
MNNPEIKRLKLLQDQYALRVSAIDTPTADKPFRVELRLKGQSWLLYIEDEYGDFSMRNQLACLFLVLRSLENYEKAEDYINWCVEHDLDASDNRWLDYFLGLEWLHREIKEAIGKIEPGISFRDYQLRSGAYHALMQSA